jgi:hypothetical protein
MNRRRHSGRNEFTPDSTGGTCLLSSWLKGGSQLGANSTQAIGVSVFFLGFTFLSIGLMTRGVIYYLLTATLLVVSFIIFAKCKPLENAEN